MLSAEQIAQLRQWRHDLDKTSRWCILINADPDSMASAMALMRIIQGKVHSVEIARINNVTRPDNLAMIRYLRIPMRMWNPDKKNQYTHFALLDSQPGHNKAFAGVPFSLLVDHHPMSEDPSQDSAFAEDAVCIVRPELGATSTLMTRFLQGLKITPSSRLATALLTGIRTDTAAFGRSGTDEDFQAYRWLSKQADLTLLRRIQRSEYLMAWLPLFTRAFQSLTECPQNGAMAWLGFVSSGDLLVAIADFFTKVHGLHWIAVSGIVAETVIVILRGDGSRDVGRLAQSCFDDVGEAGGHRNLARAEFPLSVAHQEGNLESFVRHRLFSRKLRPIRRTQETPRPSA
ncbi:MAG: DHH family phosphoesterase [Desulfovibrio sp.]|jgi:nanoRNase/pAp phosphatase (c-di-AMP/oligoRNAs hydrolase)|nr:DHH family phosphoesterase [Desulfovibrio sp.]